jgi:hypothetical protein
MDSRSSVQVVFALGKVGCRCVNLLVEAVDVRLASIDIRLQVRIVAWLKMRVDVGAQAEIWFAEAGRVVGKTREV